MQYPIFVSVREAGRLLSLGRTSIYALLNDGSLTSVKMQRSRRIFFSSIVAHSLRCLNEGKTPNSNSILVGNHESPSEVVAEKLARVLCNVIPTAAPLINSETR